MSSPPTDQALPHDLSEPVRAWFGRGSRRSLCGHQVFVVDVAAKSGQDEDSAKDSAEPLLIIHGFPTSSFDYAEVIDDLAANRRVVVFDMVGFGLSDKPDIAYTLGLQADVVIALCAELGLDRFSLLTHDMGDTVGGEVLARHLEGAFDAEIVSRVLTNGSIYIEMAQLTFGQQLLLSLPDARLDLDSAPTAESVAASLLATLHPTTAVALEALLPHGELVAHDDGSSLLPRIIRYIEERRANETRFTGAIERHPSPVTVMWGVDDPIAVVGMCDQFAAARLAATGVESPVTRLVDVGHYPVIEAPELFVAEVLDALG